jgi:hypothetical protein
VSVHDFLPNSARFLWIIAKFTCLIGLDISIY